jgi:pilus assembly protein CpaF
VVRLETRPTNSEGLGQIGVRDLVRNALRMRPDRIIIGEVRDSAALDMLQAMNTGHSGSLTTVHANSVSDAMRRLETMCLMSEIQLPLTAIREQLASAIEVVIQQTRLPDGSRRITKISEVISPQDGGYALRDVQIENRQATLGETSAEAEQVRN